MIDIRIISIRLQYLYLFDCVQTMGSNSMGQ